MFQIISDGSCDFSNEEVRKYEIDIVPFYITFDQSTYLKEGIDITKDSYFNRLLTEKNLFPKTSQPNPQDYIDIYTPHLKEGKDIVSLTISSKISGSYNSAVIAAEMLKDDFPDRNIAVIDSESACIGQGLILKEMVKMRNAGLSLDKTVELTGKVLKTTRLYFTLDTLEYLKKGGRIGPTTALVGGILGLRPILQFLNGEVSQIDNVRGKKKALELMEEAAVEALRNEKDNVCVSVGHILSEQDAAGFKMGLETELGIKVNEPIVEVGATIGTHAGPGAFAFSYCKKYDSLT
ncbi:MAG: DegV family protein [Defluviitaleaceae bacterium]|nr:DegV family protein [Defluviitaleaceae bacterium]